MKIVDSNKKVTFSTLHCGDVFRGVDAFNGRLFMKVRSNNGCNAVAVSDGELYNFSADDTVSPVNCELVIK